MILVDSSIGSRELRHPIEVLGVACEPMKLTYGDAAFEVYGPNGTMSIGVERKTLHDMLHCIDDGRYNQQRIGMNHLYQRSFLVIEGYIKAKEDGTLMEGFRDYETEKILRSQGKYREVIAWADCRYGSKRTMFSKIYRYLRSVAESGVMITHTKDLNQTAFEICELYHYYQKPWDKHTSLKQIFEPVIPSLTGKPSVVRRWAYALEGIGTEGSEHAAKFFKTPIRLATADETQWVKVAGVGIEKAQSIVKEIQGWQRYVRESTNWLMVNLEVW